MTQREFERKIKKLVPSITRITYAKIREGKNFIYNEVYIHTSQIDPRNTTQKSCHLKTGPDCLELMAKMLEVQNESTS